ncbi:MAG TPA: thiamine pyrophosphate-dependent enzyme, partial [Thauera sp.]|nr:thiamine pyrophosphate-dependent enzyme [Thauera sp.]
FHTAAKLSPSKGDFYEGLNFAAVWKAPLLVVLSNNQWAISVPRSAQSATATMAQKAIAAGVEGVQVDGNDLVAVHHVAREALAKARAGGGPTLIEAVTYRLGDHTTADDASRYRDPAVVQEQWSFEPLTRLRNHLVKLGAWGPEKEEALARECADTVNAAVEAYLSTPPPTTAAMFEHLFATLPAALAAQRDEALRFAPRTAGGQPGGDHG